MKDKRNIAYKKLLFEFISVSFAVFLGLMLNQWRDSYNSRKLVAQSLENISIEIENNSKKVQKMLDSHQFLLSKVENILAHIDHGKIPMDSMGGLNFQLINSTAWETAKLTQAIAHMDIKIVSEIAGIYEYQDYYTSTVKQYVLGTTFNQSFESEQDIRKNKKFFLDLRDFLTTKIVSSEYDLLEYYKELQEDIKRNIEN
ncbi:hypothetical protein CYCD_14150 [Tenuifilaceae bacterium CYCD]|nr:hypothetical protein CYCD_14150 [Tenuifilaceae bacterium CYCD]